MPDADDAPCAAVPARPPISKDDARLIAREVLAELSDNFMKYVGRGIIHAMGRGLLLLIMAIALYGWAHMGNPATTSTAHPTGH